jgi:hypothetical protein
MKKWFALILCLSINSVLAAERCSYQVLERDSICKKMDAMGFEFEYKCQEILLFQFSNGHEIAGSPIVTEACYQENNPNYSPYCTGASLNDSYFAVSRYIKKNLKNCREIPIEKAFR